jgi:hypothetical protein
MRKILTVIAVFIMSAGMALGQDSYGRLSFTVSGTVTDSQSGRPLESVHVSIPGRHQATVTNADGYFVLKSDREIELVEFSFLGYRSRRLKAEESMDVKLGRENLLLEESSIVSGDPKAIVEAALGRVWDTYCTHPELLRCFYRETVRKQNRYIYVAESVSKLFKGKYYGHVGADAAALEKSRVLVSQRARDTLSIRMMGGPTQAITHDIVKNGDIVFNADDMPRYIFKMEAPAYIGDRLQFVISMIPAATADYALYACTLYIDRELLTFTRVEASLDVSNKAKATRMLLVKKPSGLRFSPEEATIVINYRLDDGKTRLEYFRSTMRFTCDWKKRLFRTRYTTVNELVVTDVLPEAQPIPRKDRFRSSEFLVDKASEFLDPDFWNDYNIIEPSESLEHAIGRLRKGK